MQDVSGTLSPKTTYPLNDTLLSFKCDKTKDPGIIATKRTKELSAKQMEKIRRETCEQKRKEMRKECGLRESENPLFKLNLDLFQ